jgi:hypothetical protein
MDFIKMFLLVLVVFFIINIFTAFRKVMKQQREYLEKMQKDKEKYAVIDENLFDNIPDNELKLAIVNHIWNKEDEDYENVFDYLSEGEKIVYTIFLIESATSNGRVTIANFFTMANEKYIPYLEKSFQAIGCLKLSEIMKETLTYHQTVENGEDIIDFDEDIDFDTLPSYELYTSDYLEHAKEEQIEIKLINYIRSNKKDFISTGDDNQNEERTSTQI